MKKLTIILQKDDVYLDYNDEDPPILVSHLNIAEVVVRIERAQNEGCVIGFKIEQPEA